MAEQYPNIASILNMLEDDQQSLQEAFGSGNNSQLFNVTESNNVSIEDYPHIAELLNLVEQNASYNGSCFE